MPRRMLLAMQCCHEVAMVTELFEQASAQLGVSRTIVKAAYVLCDPETLDPFYVGTGDVRRIRMRVRDKCTGDNSELESRINSIGASGQRTSVTVLALFNNVVSGNGGLAAYHERFFKHYYMEEFGADLCNRYDMYPPTENIEFDCLKGCSCSEHPLRTYKPLATSQD